MAAADGQKTMTLFDFDDKNKQTVMVFSVDNGGGERLYFP
jgi:hypothetical protein